MNLGSKNDIPTKFLILRIWKNLSFRRKKQISFLPIMMLASAFSEMLSLASVLPFLAVITNPEKILTYPILSNFLYWADITTIDKIIIFTTLVFIIFVSFSAIIRLINLYFVTLQPLILAATLDVKLIKELYINHIKLT